MNPNHPPRRCPDCPDRNPNAERTLSLRRNDLAGCFKMPRTRHKARQPGKSSERGDRADRYFAVVTIVLMTFLALTGFGAWIFGNPSAASVNPSPPPAQTK
jgi:hypothetical protein